MVMTEQYQQLEVMNETSEACITRLQQELQETKTNLLEKERVVQLQNDQLQRQLKALEKKYQLEEEMLVFFYIFRPLLLPFTWLVRPIYRALKPRLGNINQYSPQELQIPAKYRMASFVGIAPRISIVTPSFNQGKFVERTLKSVLDQAYPNLEYYVQDGGSTDGSTEVIRRYGDRLTGWESCPDNGQSHAINLGFAKTSGEIMAWINSDDILLPGALAYVADFFCRHPDVDVIYGHRVLLDENDCEIGRWIMPSHEGQILSWEDYIPQETIFWRRRIWEKSGAKIDESFRFAMDWNMLIRFREAGAHFVRLPRFIGGFRVHQRQKTSTEISGIGFQEMDRIRLQVLGYVPCPAEIRKAVRIYLLKQVAIDLAWRIWNRLTFK
jgi:Glycosyl transferase family 2